MEMEEIAYGLMEGRSIEARYKGKSVLLTYYLAEGFPSVAAGDIKHMMDAADLATPVRHPNAAVDAGGDAGGNLPAGERVPCETGQ